MSSVAFWYQDGIAQGLPPVPYGAARLPQGNATQIEVENAIGQVKSEKGKTSVSKDLFWSKDVLLFEGQGTGREARGPVRLWTRRATTSCYAQLAQASDYGIYTVLLDGKPPVAPVLEHEPGADVRPQTQFDGYALETYVGMDYQIGWPRLSKGRHTATFVCLGKNAASSGYNLGVDNLVLARTGPAGWSKAAAVKAPSLPGTSTAGACASARGSGPCHPRAGGPGVAQRGAGGEAGAARSHREVEGPGRDRAHDVGQRDRGDWTGRGRRAVPALAAACRVEGEVTHVLRACAAALGDIGKPAAPALPVLREPGQQQAARPAFGRTGHRADRRQIEVR